MEITTRRLTLGPLSEGDRERVIDLFTNDMVKQTYILPDFETREAAIPLFHRVMAFSKDPARYVWGIFLDGMFIGLLNETGREGDSIELGYALLPAFHNKGYCTEALVGAIGYLFEGGFAAVTAAAFAENPASIRVMEKAGMEKTGKTEELEYRGKNHTCVYYEIRKP
ncbi:MAG: GNAT family N-acetyltransferase [Clostridia bacterium]|nr:GNAT family N-acetyltransferase [Clostridia bacterium]